MCDWKSFNEGTGYVAAKKTQPTVPASNFCSTLGANVDNPKMTDGEFREFVRNSLPIVIYPRPTIQV